MLFVKKVILFVFIFINASQALSQGGIHFNLTELEQGEILHFSSSVPEDADYAVINVVKGYAPFFSDGISIYSNRENVNDGKGNDTEFNYTFSFWEIGANFKFSITYYKTLEEPIPYIGSNVLIRTDQLGQYTVVETSAKSKILIASSGPDGEHIDSHHQWVTVSSVPPYRYESLINNLGETVADRKTNMYFSLDCQITNVRSVSNVFGGLALNYTAGINCRDYEIYHLIH